MSNHKIKVIFMGTPDFAIPCLRAIINDRQFEVAGVITQPDKKIGRKQAVTPPPVKVEAKKYGIPVHQPNQITNYQLPITNYHPDVIIVAAYAQILPEEILKIPKYGCINVHASLLPEYRGASPIQAAILNGDKQTGATIMKMDTGLDTGPILAQKAVNISSADTAGALFNKLSIMGAELLLPTLKKYIAGKITPQPQDENHASYAKILAKKDGRIDWHKSAVEIERLARAMDPWPGAFTLLNNRSAFAEEGRILKILEVECGIVKINKYKTGELFLYNNMPAAQCGKDALALKKLQLSGTKAMTAEEFARGYRQYIGSIMR